MLDVITLEMSLAPLLWKKWPAIISASPFLSITAIGYLAQGNFETSLLAHVIWGWELYFFSYLEIAFVISSFIGSARCERHALRDLYSK